MSKKKQGGKVSQAHQRKGKRLGLKISGGEKVTTGSVLLRQRGTKFVAGLNVGVGRDHTLFSLIRGIVQFKRKSGRQTVNVVQN